jgi:hypothetical protein
MSGKKKYSVLAISIILIAIAFLGFTNRKLIMAHYFNYKVNHFNKGDKVYAYKYFVSDVTSLELPLKRLIKSTISSDFKLISSGNAIVNDSLSKYRSSYIGTYIGYKMFPAVYKNKEVMQSVYSIELNWKVVKKNASTQEPLPPNYIFADNNFYLTWASCVNKELNKFN